MKTIVYCHSGLIYRVSDRLYERFRRAAQNDICDSDELQRINKEISCKYLPIQADYLATAADEEAGLYNKPG